jgi:hypothetical protein
MQISLDPWGASWSLDYHHDFVQNALTHNLEYEHPNIQDARAIDVPLLDKPAHHFHH